MVPGTGNLWRWDCETASPGGLKSHTRPPGGCGSSVDHCSSKEGLHGHINITPTSCPTTAVHRPDNIRTSSEHHVRSLASAQKDHRLLSQAERRDGFSSEERDNETPRAFSCMQQGETRSVWQSFGRIRQSSMASTLPAVEMMIPKTNNHSPRPTRDTGRKIGKDVGDISSGEEDTIIARGSTTL